MIAPNFTPTGQQVPALQELLSWYRKHKTGVPAAQCFLMYGFAGVGKTSLVYYFLQEGNIRNVALGAYTGKAARVIASKSGRDARTIHSLIYKLQENPTTGQKEWVINMESVLWDVDLVVLDECSNIGKQMFDDLLFFKKPILFLGDPGQLPPVKQEDIFTGIKPNIFLTEVHRQALDSPILKLATMARMGEHIPYGSWKDPSGATKVWKLKQEEIDPQGFLDADIILTGRNTTRTGYNNWFRRALGRTSEFPQVGDRMICLKNQRDKGLLNGLMGTITTDTLLDEVDGEAYPLELVIDDEEEVGPRRFLSARDVLFGEQDKNMPFWMRNRWSEFTYGFAITVHKSQGSQFNKGILVDEWRSQDRNRWLYTGITRFADTLCILA